MSNTTTSSDEEPPRKVPRNDEGLTFDEEEFFRAILEREGWLEQEEEEEFDPDNYDEEIRREITGIEDLIELGRLYNERGKRKRYNVDVRALSHLIDPLERLQALIGMKKVKESIVDLIVYYMQRFEKGTSNMLHTVLEGPPGCGKTTVAHIIASIYLRLGVISSDKFVVAKRSDLVGKYLGHTASKTQKVIDSARGGVLFIDEAYSLGNPEGRDSFSKECIDTINQNLTEGKCDFICIIAGYREDLARSFFAYNKGLERRFPFRYTIDPYSSFDLFQIYCKMAHDAGWGVADCITAPFFEEHRQSFPFNGGDMETLFQMTKIAHARRVFCLPRANRKTVTHADLERGFQLFCDNEEVRRRSEPRPSSSMYL